MPAIGLDSADARHLDVVGGKAANLAELTAAGFAVPQAFCVTTAAYREAAATAGIDALHDKELGAGLPAAAREALLGVTIPPRLAADITGRYAALGPDVPVAVRSSATAEDCQAPVSPASRTRS
ncbi:MAG: hypothetical protein L0H84_04835 [Pseudonocardia sp.]|nr:hypothetical protein [Pseudonocardia sp.]